ncbi:MAG: hypothetical protein JNL21_04605 [Myxococcales bacterium]|nr:hypothetical protein [Myxococcales bacterium]
MTATSSRRRRSPTRDQAASPFALILEQLLEAVPFVRGAAIFDFEGETVDYAGELEPFDLKVSAATFQLVLADLRTCAWLSSTQQISLSTARAGYVLRILDESYCLLLVVRPLGTYAVSQRALDETAYRILTEAGLAAGAVPGWYRVEVEAGTVRKGARPLRLRPVAPLGATNHDSPWLDVDVLGALVGLGKRERGFRIRLASGAEVTLLRESRRLWFIDERIDVSSPALLAGGRMSDVFGDRSA